MVEGKEELIYEERKKSHAVEIACSIAPIVGGGFLITYIWLWGMVEDPLWAKTTLTLIVGFGLSVGVIAVLYFLSFKSLRIYSNGLYVPKVPIKNLGKDIFLRFSDIKECTFEKYKNEGASEIYHEALSLYTDEKRFDIGLGYVKDFHKVIGILRQYLQKENIPLKEVLITKRGEERIKEEEIGRSSKGS